MLWCGWTKGMSRHCVLRSPWSQFCNVQEERNLVTIRWLQQQTGGINQFIAKGKTRVWFIEVLLSFHPGLSWIDQAKEEAIDFSKTTMKSAYELTWGFYSEYEVLQGKSEIKLVCLFIEPVHAVFKQSGFGITHNTSSQTLFLLNLYNQRNFQGNLIHMFLIRSIFSDISVKGIWFQELWKRFIIGSSYDCR